MVAAIFHLDLRNTSVIHFTFVLPGFYIKTGQMAASNIGNAFPKVWQNTLSVVQDQCPHKDFEVIRAIIEDEMGKPLTHIFETFEETPIGAASIGQVHRATLKNGEP